MVKLFNKSTGEFIGRISEADLAFLAEQLEEESIHDTDYYIRKETLDHFVQQGGSTHLMEVLKGGFRNAEALEVRWERDNSA